MNEILGIILSAAAGAAVALVGSWFASRRNDNFTDSSRVESDLQRTAERIESAGSGLDDISGRVESLEGRIDSAEGRLESAADTAERIASDGNRVEELLTELDRRAAEDDF